MDERVARIGSVLREGCEELGVPINDSQVELLGEYACAVLRANEEFNLTSIVDPAEFGVKHLVDSLLCVKAGIPWGPKGIDVGTGAGFPGVPLGIYCPEAEIHLLDSLTKRMYFLRDTIERLGADNLHTVIGRAEDIGRQAAHRQQYDWAVARAVAPLPVLLEYCSPLVKLGGRVLALKGQLAERELQEARPAMEILGLRTLATFRYKLPLEMGDRTLILFEKTKETPASYPRKAGIPTKRPLK